MDTIVLASNNSHKLKEFKQIYKDTKVLSLNDIGFFDEIEETGKSFLENSLIKAKVIHIYLKKKNIIARVIADDSGLCVDSLNGEPGIYSARYGGEHNNDAKNRIKLLENLKEKDTRNAYFCCTLVEIFPNGDYISAEGFTYGHILEEEKGDTSFGYDCIFYSNELNKTFGEATKEEKNSVSHRGRAIIALKNKENIYYKNKEVNK